MSARGRQLSSTHSVHHAVAFAISPSASGNLKSVIELSKTTAEHHLPDETTLPTTTAHPAVAF
jgi:hypothetical protein